MNDRSNDSKLASQMLDVLQKELSSDPRGQRLLLRFLKAPDKYSQDLTDYLYRRFSTDGDFKERLLGSQELPSEMRTIVNGGQVDKIIQIAQAGTVTIHKGIPVWVGLLAVVVATVAVVALVFTVIPKPLPPMGNGFNVAVAQFVMVDENGKTSTSDISSQFSDGLFETIGNGVKALPPSLTFDLRGPSDIVDPVVDEVSAAQVANDVNATILIYGRVSKTADGKYTVEPHFHISERATFNYGSEITGPDNLGTPISDLTLDEKGKFNFSEELDARIRALRGIIRGLGYFYIDDYKAAAEEFQAAINVPNWDPQDGQEVAYLLLGSVQLRAWDLIQNPDVLSDASDTFAEIQRINPNYPRSFLGLGAVALAEAQIVNEDHIGIGSVDKEKLEEAIRWYKAGLDVEQPAQAYIPIKSAFGLAQAYSLGYEFHVLDDAKESASLYFQQVIEAHQKEQGTIDLVWYAAHAHAGLGRLAGLDGDWDTMTKEFRKAITTWDDAQRVFPSTNPPKIWIARFWSNVAFAEEKLAHPDEAIACYEQAIMLGEGLVGSQELANWQAALERLRKGNPQ